MHNQLTNVALLLYSLLLSSITVALSAGESPFTPKAYLLRYWNKEIRSDLPKPAFFLSKASPLKAVDSARFTKLAAANSLSTQLPVFCSAAGLLCFPDLSPSLEKQDSNAKFAVYSDRNFSNYATVSTGGLNAFKNYSNEENMPVDSFRRYSRDATGHSDKFASYGIDGNVVDQSFNSYGASATGGAGKFNNYNDGVNVPNLKFSSYAAEGNGRAHAFNTYTGSNANSGKEGFAGYGKNGNGALNEFNNYAESSNVIGSTFSGYGENGNGANDTFKSYGHDGNVPENGFRSYGDGGNAAVDSFVAYRDKANVGTDSFQSYAKNSNSGKVNFANYGNSFNEGADTFSGYGKGAKGQKIGFKIYGVNNTFQDYAKKDKASFAMYSDKKGGILAMATGSKVNRWVEPGKFFREAMLKEGTVMPMPDVRDKMPKRSFLPRRILQKLPFSSSKLDAMKQIFRAGDNSTMESMFLEALADCERAPSRGETKRCVGSGEDMIDFATSILGRNIVVRSTENTNGSSENILIGSVKGIDGGKVTKSVSCHQSLFPYLLYYCHSVPKVRVYEADILDPKAKSKINHGVAICHLDTSDWSPSHGAFMALGPGPGKIEVCHWIFENDMTWTVAN